MGNLDAGLSISKGSLVHVTESRCGWRRLTTQERNEWYENFYKDCREGRDVWHDDAGESKLAPQDDTVVTSEKLVYTVLRSRVRAPCGYGTTPGCAELLCTATGVRFFVRRHLLKNLSLSTEE